MQYSVTVSDAQGVNGVAMTTSFVSEFTTSGPDACPCSLMESSTSPVVSDSQDTGAVTLGLKFTSSADGFIKGLRYYRDAANAGTHTGKLWKADGTELASLTFDDSGSGWQTANFSSPVSITGRNHLRRELLRTERSLLRGRGRLHQPGGQHALEHRRQW